MPKTDWKDLDSVIAYAKEVQARGQGGAKAWPMVIAETDHGYNIGFAEQEHDPKPWTSKYVVRARI